MITLLYINEFSPNGGCIDIVEICFGIADRQISSIFDMIDLSARDTSVLFFLDDNLLNINEFSPDLVCASIL